jgi:hypothetical protein
VEVIDDIVFVLDDRPLLSSAGAADVIGDTGPASKPPVFGILASGVTLRHGR